MNSSSVFTNSCLKVPVDPINKMPKAAYERTNKTLSERSSLDSSTTCSISTVDVDKEKVKLFYRSIPDYTEINHLSSTEFYSTLKSLREKKKSVLGLTVELVDNDQQYDDKTKSYDEVYDLSTKKENIVKIDNEKSSNTVKLTRKKRALGSNKVDHESVAYSTQKQDKINDDQLAGTDTRNINKVERSNRNHSACSISWHDDKNSRNKNEIDKKFDKFFQVTKLDPFDSRQQCTTQSMPSSPLRTKSFSTISRKKKNVTIPKPFKMTERDDQEKIANELRTLQKSFSEDILNQKRERKQFRARPVPIESRIPLYDKILEDQAMRFPQLKLNFHS
ncbi:unnamed protein product [Parnassius apollo]|uniref:(apollo) hypothetical protein n=1 Tax=Parnassius apollo TaxID=110799 RepID=A0A8S3WCU8_PARAO|nr:unnamed protein product [Parnassius apollo]